MPRDVTEGRWSNPFAKRALEAARSVNPSYVDKIEPIGWAEYNPSAPTLNDRLPDIYSTAWALLGSLPLGETLGLAVRRNTGMREPYSLALYDPPPTYAHSLSRDAVNLATLPMGFLRALKLGIPADLVSDVAASLYTGQWPDASPEPARDTTTAPRPRAATTMAGWDRYVPPASPAPPDTMPARPNYRFYTNTR
jgi:hypothetical protein